MRRRGYTLLELSLASSLLAVILLVSTLLLHYGMRSWRNLDRTQDASFRLATATRSLQDELRQTSFNECKVQAQSEGLGDLICFLSALDEPSGEMLFQPDGSPFWQRNVIYYLALPPDHRCGVPADCPHKRLLRLALDSGKPTTADTDPAVSEEELIANPLASLQGTPRTIAVNLLSLRIQLAPQRDRLPDEVMVDLSVESDHQMQHLQFSVFPRNAQ